MRWACGASAACLLAACSGSVRPDGGVADAGGQGCSDDLDCAPDGGSQGLFRCNLTTFTCEPACRTRDDCSEAARGADALPECAGPLGCQCQEGRCVATLCSADSECAPDVCRGGQCVAQGSAPAAASCSLAPDFVVAPPGAHVRFSVLARSGQGEPLALSSGVAWSADAFAVPVEVGGGGIAEYELAAATAGPVAGIRAAVGSASCSARVYVLGGTLAATALRVVALDAAAGRPVPGAQVQAIAALGDGGAQVAEARTNADGVAVLDVDPGLPLSVSAFHADYGYLTLASAPPNGGARELYLRLQRNSGDARGGFRGTFTDVPQRAAVRAGLAGGSLAPAPADLLASLFEPTSPTDVSLGSWVEQGAPLPEASYLTTADAGFKPGFAFEAPSGVCTRAPAGFATAEEAILAGRCGTTSAWSLAGAASLPDLPLDALSQGLANASTASLVSKLIPLAGGLASSVARDVEYGLASTDGGAVPDSQLAQRDLAFAQLRLGLRFVARAPELPQVQGRYLDSVVVLPAADVGGRGYVPLGLGAAVNQNADALTDAQLGLGSQGLVSVKQAPAHQGLEGSEYVLLTTALWREGGAGGRHASSTVFTRLGQGPLPYDPTGLQPIPLGAGFLPVPEGARYRYSATAGAALGPRELLLGADAAGLFASAVRAVFTGPGGRTWTVVLDPQTAAAGFAVPLPPPGMEDRTFDGARRASLRVELLRAGTWDLLPAAALFDGAISPEALRAMTTGTSAFDLLRPEVSWLVPAADGASVRVGGELRVRVSAFDLGSSGRVVFQFPECGLYAVGLQDPAHPREVVTTIPSGCNTQVHAYAALQEDGPLWAPLDPPVSASRLITVTP